MNTDNVITIMCAGKEEEDDDDDDRRLAVKMFVVEQLIESYGFDSTVANDAFDTIVDTVSTKASTGNEGDTSNENNNNKYSPMLILEQCCSYILENKIGTDHGGPIIPIDTCPHIIVLNPNTTSLLRTNSNDDGNTVNYYYPYPAKCTFDMNKEHSTNNTENQQIPIIVVGKSIRETIPDNTVNDDNNNNNNNDSNDDNNSDNKYYKCPSTENWLCLHCGVIRCSRYVNGHNIRHWDEETLREHCITISLTDLSVWCHECNSYINNPKILDPIINQLQTMKFT